MNKQRFIYKYRDTVRLVQNVIRCVNVTQADRVGRIYQHAFVEDVFSDQDFFEAINWYAVKAIRIASERSLRSSRKCEFDGVRFWNSCVISITPLLGDHPWSDVSNLVKVAFREAEK